MHANKRGIVSHREPQQHTGYTPCLTEPKRDIEGEGYFILFIYFCPDNIKAKQKDREREK